MSHESRLLLSAIISGAITAQIMNLWFNGSVFEGPRGWVAKYAPLSVSELMTCPLCLSHWIAVAGMYLAAAYLETEASVFKTTPAILAYWLFTACVANLVYYKFFHHEELPGDPLLAAYYKEG